jgi:hypothetical protein
MLKLIPPNIDLNAVESAYFVIDNEEFPIISLRMHHFVMHENLFDRINNFSVKIIFKDATEQVFNRASKYGWLFCRDVKAAKMNPFKINAESIYKNTLEDKAVISEMLNEKYLEATNATIGIKGKRNLLYYSVGASKDYLSLLQQSVLSVYEKCADVNFDVLFICPESWVVDISAFKPADAIFKFHIIEDTDDGVEISKNKTKIFDFIEIGKYRKILFLDADIIAARDIQHIFAATYVHEKLYVKCNRKKVTYDSHGSDYHGLKHLTPDQISQMRDKNQLPFNAGQFLFLNSNKMQKHFENLNWLMSIWPGPYFFEQSFMNHYFCLYNLTDNDAVGKKIKLISTVEPNSYNPFIDHNDILIHFIAPALNAIAKTNYIEQYKDAYLS